MDRSTKPATVAIGDSIVFDSLPGFKMTVLDVKSCETDANRGEPHHAFRIIDPEGQADWLCAYDVTKVG
ncbi:hypothetical protein K1T35_48450 (plasmid) [Pseudonocardia sp. DSM 110487]|uniref:hypothetical protein n=1 Tax=Pseudonocardia sp. DSM 110487 TaxID=2865833 RepID=UPI001C6A101F|nr:hypothetical protein [Pseudonocardia sp. DSM 110487]QYN41180.1 hypothetical protein K1T35_48450 [Pseudonocardia sp. DSM 110487]